MAKKLDLITIGGITKDIFLVTKSGKIFFQDKEKYFAFPYGEKIYLDQREISLGGGACNVAVGAQRLGLKAGLCACFNEKEEEGKWVKESLKKEKISLKFLQTTLKENTGFSVVLVNKKASGHDHTLFSLRGANKYLKINRQEKFPCSWLYLASLSGKWEKNYQALKFIIKKQKINLALNPGFRQIKAGLKKIKPLVAEAKILIVNREEAQELLSEEQRFLAAPAVSFLLKGLFKYCPHLIIITDGRKGAFAYDGEKIYFQKCWPAKKIVDTTGAGDSFSAGFLASYIQKNNLPKALAAGARNAASVIQYYGAQKGLRRK